MLASTAVHAGVTLWEKWGIDPSAFSIPEACEKAPTAIQGFRHLPQDVKEGFIGVVGTSCKGYVRDFLTPGTRLQEMWSGIGAREKIVGPKEVGYISVSHAPDGREYKEDSVSQTPMVFLWKFTSQKDGKTYLLYLPWVCFNWSWGYGVTDPGLQCVTVDFSVEPGDEIRFAIFARKRLPSSACWQLCDGDICSAPPVPCDNCNWIGPRSVIADGLEPIHTGKYTAQSAQQILRLPLAAKAEEIFLCDERKGFGHSDSWHIPPSAWSSYGKNDAIYVPYGGHQWPVWGVYGTQNISAGKILEFPVAER